MDGWETPLILGWPTFMCYVSFCKVYFFLHQQMMGYLTCFLDDWKKHEAIQIAWSKHVETNWRIQAYRCVHPGRLTWNLRMHPWKRRNIFQTIIFRFYVNLGGCKVSWPQSLWDSVSIWLLLTVLLPTLTDMSGLLVHPPWQSVGDLLLVPFTNFA